MPSFLRQTYKDYSNEATKNHNRITTITAANFTAINTNVASFLTAEDALTLGARQTEEIISDEIFVNAALPTDRNSQRERKWLVTYQTTAGNKYHYTIPCAAVTGATSNPLLLSHEDLADLSQPEWVAWISAFTTLMLGKDGNGVSSVLSAELIGRSL